MREVIDHDLNLRRCPEPIVRTPRNRPPHADRSALEVFLDVLDAHLVELADRIAGQNCQEPGLLPVRWGLGTQTDITWAVPFFPLRTALLRHSLDQYGLDHKLDFEFHGWLFRVELPRQPAVPSHLDRLFGRENFLLFSRGLFD